MIEVRWVSPWEGISDWGGLEAGFQDKVNLPSWFGQWIYMHVHFGEINGAFRFVYFTSYMSYFNKKFTETATLRSAYLSVCQQFQSWAMYSVGEAVKKGVLQALLVGCYMSRPHGVEFDALTAWVASSQNSYVEALVSSTAELTVSEIEPLNGRLS